MKRKILSVLLLALILLNISACGEKKEVKDIGPAQNNGSSFNLDSVELGEYKGIEITLDGDYSVDDAEVNEYIEQLIAYYGVYGKSDETEVKSDSVVNVDYTGYQDNQPFDRGAAQDRNIDIQNNGYIAGFADPLVGHKVGDTFRADVTFPEDYGVDNLNGATVQFEYTINYICEPVTVDSLTDELTKQYFQMDTVEALIADTRTYLEEQKGSQKISDERSAIMSKLIETSTINLPNEEVESRTQEYIDKYVSAYVSDDQTLEDYLTQYYNMTYDEFYAEQKKGVEDDMTLEYICQAVASKENITIDENEYASYVDYFLQNSNYEDEKSLYEAYGSDEASGKEYFRKMFLCNQALSFIVDNAIINTK